MNALWIILGVGFFGVVVSTMGWSHGRSRLPDLGFVSREWIAEHRVSQAQDRQR